MVDKAALGAVGAPFTMDIERGKIHEFARAVRSSHPAHFAGDDPVIPPTFLTTMFFWEELVPGSNPWHEVKMDQKRGMHAEQLASSMDRLRRLFDVFDQKTALLQLLDISHRAQGVQIYIGGESGIVPLDEMSVVTAPYEVNGQIVGTLGVVGPTRMAYERIIPIVDLMARLLSNAMTLQRSDA